jgi:hypothetical protein
LENPTITWPFGTGLLAVVAADVNGDSNLVFVTSGTAVTVLLNNGDGTFRAAQAVGLAGSSVIVADFNGDGLHDITQIDGSGTSVDVILNAGTPPSGGRGNGHK